MPDEDSAMHNPIRAEAQRRLHERRFGDQLDGLEPTAMMHELEVRGQELQMQNEHLQDTLRELQQEREQFRKLFLHSPVAHFILNQRGEILNVNPAGCSLLCRADSQLLMRRFAVFVKPEQRAEFSRSLRDWFESPPGAPQQLMLERADGTHVHVHLQSIHLDSQGNEPHCLLALTDITELLEAQWQLQRLNSTLEERVQDRTLQLQRTVAQLHHQAHHDYLTGLPNRLAFTSALGTALAAPRRTFGVLYCDVDRFKSVNDSLGHEAGDQLLIELARRLCKVVRAPDRVARLGGDEFALLLHDVRDEDAVERVVHRLNSLMQAPFLLQGHELHLTLSTGMLVVRDQNRTPEDILRDVDIAMYRAKRNGQGQLRLFTSEMREGLHERLTLEGQLRQAVNRQELRVLYQPLVSLADGALLGLEALVRWQHPQRGLLSPADFVPLAEEVGFMQVIDRWVGQQCCRDILAWQESGVLGQRLWMNVNVSARHLGDVEAVMASCEDAVQRGLWNWQVEITERVVGDWREGDEDALATLSRLGVRLVVDDFGVGYSSLSMLRRFPVSMLKIDRSFIADLCDHAELVRGIVLMGEAMGMTVVAEGVETTEQQDHLLRLGVKIAQGYRFAPPLTPRQVERYARHE